VGTKEYSPSFHREYLSVNAAIAQAAAWAFVGPVLWLFHDYVLRGTEMWRSFSELDWQIQRVLLGP